MDDIILGLRRATKTVWNREDAKSNGFRLSDGEPGYDKTNHVIKIGDGVSKFANLPSIGGGTSFDGGNINNSATILADGASDLKWWGIQYIDDTGATQHFRMNASNSSDYLSLTSSDSRIGTIISVKYDGTFAQFRGSVSNANTITLKQSNMYTTSDGSLGKYGISLNNSDIIGANAIVFADECDGTEGLLFPKKGITSGPSVARSPSDFYILRGYRGELYFAGNQVITTASKSSWMLDSSLNLDATDGTWRGYQIRYTVPGTSTQYNYYIGANSETGYLNLASNNPDIGDILRCKMDGSKKIFNGNANTATRLAASRTISLTGNVTGSTSTNLSGNVSISTTVANAPASAITGTLPVAHGGTGGTTAAAARSSLAVPGVKTDGNYWGLTSPQGESDIFFRVPTQGIIPWTRNDSAGEGYVGTSTWKFKEVWAINGNFNNITGGSGWLRVGSQLICWGTFTKPYNATTGATSNYYGDMSGKTSGYLTKYPVYFSSTPISVSITGNQATTQIVNLEAYGYNRYGITDVRVHRTNSFNDTAGLKVSWIAFGPA